jgi:hypothetical protein
MNGAKYREILDENLLQSAQDLRLGQRFTFQQISTQPGQLRIVFRTLPEPGLEPDPTSLERPENTCAATLPIQHDRA